MSKLPEYCVSNIKNGNMSAFMYGSPKGNSRFVGSKKKNKRMKRGK